MSKSADQLLSEKIIAQLKERGLLRDSGLEKLSKLYAKGKVAEGDWLMLVESSLKGGNEDDKKN